MSTWCRPEPGTGSLGVLLGGSGPQTALRASARVRFPFLHNGQRSASDLFFIFYFLFFFLRQEHVNIIIFCFVLSRVPFLLISLSRIQDERPQPLVRCPRRSGCRPGRAQWGPGLLQGQHLGGRGACLGSDVLPTLITDFPRLCSHATRHPLILVLRDPGPSRILHMRGPPSPGRTAEELRGVRARGQPRSVPQPARPGSLPPVAARSKT